MVTSKDFQRWLEDVEMGMAEGANGSVSHPQINMTLERAKDTRAMLFLPHL